MALTVRLSPRAERALNAAARRRRMSRSDVVREALEQYEAADREHVDAEPYQAWVDVLGVVKLGVRQPAQTTGEQFTTILRGQVRAPRAR